MQAADRRYLSEEHDIFQKLQEEVLPSCSGNPLPMTEESEDEKEEGGGRQGGCQTPEKQNETAHAHIWAGMSPQRRRRSVSIMSETNSNSLYEGALQLCSACADGDLEMVEELLQEGVNVNAYDYDRRTALHLASAEGNVTIVEYLIKNRANPHCKDRWNGYPLREAVLGGHLEVRGILIEAGAKLEDEDLRLLAGKLAQAAATGDVKEAARMLDIGISPNAEAQDRRTPLHLASADGHVEVVKLLLERRADVRKVDRWGQTPWFDAKEAGHWEIESILRAAAGSDGSGSQKDELKKSIQDLDDLLRNACGKQTLGDVRAILDMKADVNSADYDGRTSLHIAAAEGKEDVVEHLILVGGDVNARDRWKGTPLRDALREKHYGVAAMLRSAGVKGGLDSFVDCGEMICAAAARGALDDLRDMILYEGVSVDSTVHDDRSALHLAAAEGHAPVVQFLIENKANVCCKDRFGATALKDAVRGGHKTVQDLLIQAGCKDEGEKPKIKPEVLALIGALVVGIIACLVYMYLYMDVLETCNEEGGCEHPLAALQAERTKYLQRVLDRIIKENK